MGSELIPYQDVEKMAVTAFKAGIFGFKTIEQAISLMLVCQAEGLHPMKATQLFDILPTGKVGMKSAAMLANFQARGGKVKWVTMTDTECEAIFSSPGLSEPVTVKWTWADAVKAGLNTKQNWRAYPRQMLAARVTTDGVNRADPAARLGFYPTEVVQDIEEDAKYDKWHKNLTAGAPTEEQGKAMVGEPAPAETPEEPTERPGIFEPDTMSAEEARDQIANIYSKTTEGPDPGRPPASRQVLREAFGTPLVDELPQEKKSRRRGPQEPTGPPPQKCPKCESPVEEYVSNSKTHPGRRYLACSWAYGQRMRLVDIGATPQEAQGHVAEHFRAWKEAAK